MLFDDIVSQIFDEIVNWVSRLDKELPLLEEILKDSSSKKILDVGCSTGAHSIALGRKGYDVTGIDYSNYSIKKARENLSEAYLPEGVSVKFYQDDFSVFSELAISDFDAILVLGNTLSLAESASTVLKVLLNMKELLEDDGVIIVQVLNFGSSDSNYHLLPIKEIRWEGDDCLVQRGYFIHRGSGTFLFNVIRKSEDNWNYWLQESSEIYPFNENRFRQIIERAGLEIKKLYGGFDRSAFHDESKDIIAILGKA